MSTTTLYDKIAGMIDHAILHPAVAPQSVRAQIAEVCEHRLASVCVRPDSVELATQAVRGTLVKVGTVIGFPHGCTTPAVKAAEADEAFRKGAADVDMVVNVGSVLGEAWDDVLADIKAVLDVTREHGGVIKVIFETDFLPEDRYKIALCEICGELGVDYVKTSTGFGYVKGDDGRYAYMGATEHDVALMRRHSPETVGVKPSGGVRTLEQVLRFIELGATRIGTTSTQPILESAKRAEQEPA